MAFRRGNYLWEDNRGEKNPNSKLTWKQVREMRQLFEREKWNLDRIARKFPNVARKRIAAIVARREWKNDPEEEVRDVGDSSSST